MKKYILLCLLAIGLSSVALADSETTVGEWMVLERISPIDDSVDLIAITSDGDTSLVVKCEAGEPIVAILSNLYFSSNQGYAKVVVRWGKDSPSTTKWLILRSGLLALLKENNKDFMAQLLNHDTLAVQMTGYSRTQTAVFQLHRSREALANILQACPAFTRAC